VIEKIVVEDPEGLVFHQDTGFNQFSCPAGIVMASLKELVSCR
jgi:hypothetical protein